MSNLRWPVLLLALALPAVAGTSIAPAASPVTPPAPAAVDGIPYQKGMVYGIYFRGGETFHRENLKAIKDLGVDTIQIVVPRRMETIRATAITTDDPSLTPTRESLEQAVREAHRLGLKVFLFPIVFVTHLHEGEWRGVLAPASWRAWWQQYDAFILEEARWAAARKVAYFSVGSELLSTEAMDGRWRSLIRRVRQVYPGLITYSANWDQLDVMTFADALDFLGMNAYFQVGDGAPTLPGMLASWQEPLAAVARWQAQHDKPVVVTEVGYPSRRGGTVDPWNYLGEGAADVEEQDLGYRAFIMAWDRQPWLAGVYFYYWWDDPTDGGRGYTPRGKPAARTLSRWYTSNKP